MGISYFYQKSSFRIPQVRKTSSWLYMIAKKEKCLLGDLQYVFCTDGFLLKLNQQFLKHNTLTDIITFDYSNRKVLEGEIYISVDRVRENATSLAIPFSTELRRVMAHGVLHMAGYSDKTRAQKGQMRKKEEACLSLWL